MTPDHRVPGRSRSGSELHPNVQPDPAFATAPAPLERRGRRWIFGSFVLCPCHLPLTLGVLATVFGGTAVGVVLRDHAVLAGAVISAGWMAGTWRGLRLIRLAQRGACPLPTRASGTRPRRSRNGRDWPPSPVERRIAAIERR